jgi:hypothetical protein
MEPFYNLALPGDATFDVESLVKQLSSDPMVFRDPHMAQPTFVFCENQTMLDYLQSKLKANPDYAYGYIEAAITLRPDYISVYNAGSKATKEKLAQFVLPLIKDLHCRIGNEYSVDITDRYRGQFEKLFYR